MRPTLEERFNAGYEVTPDGCWEWQRQRNRSGYGRIRANNRLEVAHRVAYELLVGPIPDGLQLDHLCRNRACVNPEHLEPVTAHENALRGAWAGKTHCANGHEYTPENTFINIWGHRRCLECRRDTSRRYRAREAAKREAAA